MINFSFDQIKFNLFCLWIPPQDNLSQLRPAFHLANGDNFSSAQWFIYQGTILSVMKQILFYSPTILDNHHYDNQSLLILPISILLKPFPPKYILTLL
jgi:hypothetical protein